MTIILQLLFSLLLNVQAQSMAHYRVLPGEFHKSGNVDVTVLAKKFKFDVKMDYAVKTKPYIPVPDKLLKGSKTYEFPVKFKSEAGYMDLQKQKRMTIPKAVLKFVKRGNVGRLRGAYFIQVLPTNKKTKIDIIYHPSLPSVGWAKIKITFLSKLPMLDGYVIEGEPRAK